jgi:mannosyltransferase OCH1-like enzyme
VIPKIIHRTLPAVPRDDVAPIWAKVVANTPGWERRTYQSPRDPAEWPLTGHLFSICRDRAEESDLVRLEALWVHGGVYLDSDMEVTQNLDWVLPYSCLTGWEDANFYGMAFIAAEPRHPAIRLLMEEFVKHVEAQTQRSTFPAVATRVWAGRTDVTVLPQKALYPYTYHERNTEKATFDWSTDPEVYAAHHWHASWVK